MLGFLESPKNNKKEELDLFEHYETLPKEVIKVLNRTPQHTKATE